MAQRWIAQIVFGLGLPGIVPFIQGFDFVCGQLCVTAVTQIFWVFAFAAATAGELSNAHAKFLSKVSLCQPRWSR